MQDSALDDLSAARATILRDLQETSPRPVLGDASFVQPGPSSSSSIPRLPSVSTDPLAQARWLVGTQCFPVSGLHNEPACFLSHALLKQYITCKVRTWHACTRLYMCLRCMHVQLSMAPGWFISSQQMLNPWHFLCFCADGKGCRVL